MPMNPFFFGEEDDDNPLFPEHTPPEEMTPIQLLNHVEDYGLIVESPYQFFEDGLESESLTEEEIVYFTCIMLCTDRLEQVQADFVLFAEHKDAGDTFSEHMYGSIIDGDVSPWIEATAEFESTVRILENMRIVFEDLLIDSLDRRIGAFFCKYVIVSPFQVCIGAPPKDIGESELEYYPEIRAVTIWGFERMN